MDGAVFCPTGKIIPLKAESVVRPTFNPVTQTMVDLPLGEMSLKPGDSWNALVRFGEYTSEEINTRQNGIIMRMQDDIYSKYQSAPSSYTNTMVEAGADIVGDAKDFFFSQFKLSEGQYKLLLMFKASDGHVICSKAFGFILNSYHIDILKRHLEGYKYGYGIYLETQSNHSITARLNMLHEKDISALGHKLKQITP
jgi:hypothetical protein